MVELIEVMRQRSDFELISLLNKIREEEIDDQVEYKVTLFKGKIFSPTCCIWLQKKNHQKNIMKRN